LESHPEDVVASDESATARIIRKERHAVNQSIVLADRAWPGVGFWKDAALVMSGAALVALGAHLSIPLRPVPITGQTFGVLLVGAALGWRRGACAMLVYLVAGAAGLPVFAPGGLPGLARFQGPTVGYLLAYPVAAAIVGFLCERGWDRRPISTACAMALGSIPIFLLGAAWLARFVGAGEAVSSGILPFLPGDAIKAALAAACLPLAWTLLGEGRKADHA
jgi:biotin transport system substrate-specific component